MVREEKIRQACLDKAPAVEKAPEVTAVTKKLINSGNVTGGPQAPKPSSVVLPLRVFYFDVNLACDPQVAVSLSTILEGTVMSTFPEGRCLVHSAADLLTAQDALLGDGAPDYDFIFISNRIDGDCITGAQFAGT